MTTSKHVYWQSGQVSRGDREALHGHRGALLWITGLSGSGKTTLAHALERALNARRVSTYVLDGDNMRHGLCADLGFGDADRRENIRRVGEVAKLFVDAGIVVMSAFISPFRADRDRIRASLPAGCFFEVYCDCPLEVCESRDVKGLYAKARAGMIQDFTGLGSAYEAPRDPEIRLATAVQSVEACVEAVLRHLEQAGVLGRL